MTLDITLAKKDFFNLGPLTTLLEGIKASLQKLTILHLPSIKVIFKDAKHPV